MIDADAIQKRKAELTEQRDNLLANLNAVTGAIQDCEYWLEQLKQGEEANVQH